MKKRNYWILLIKIVLGILGIFLLYTFFLGAFIGLYDFPERVNWKDKTTPIDTGTKAYLCLTFALQGEQLCKSDHTTYGPEFYRFIASSFCPESESCVSVDEVQEKIGEFKYREDLPETLSPGVAGRYWYDFQNDHVFPLVISFNLDWTIRKIQFSFSD